MRSYRYFILGIVLHFVLGVAAVDRHPVNVRQDESSSPSISEAPQPTNGDSFETATSAVRPDGSSTRTSERHIQTITVATASSSKPTTTTIDSQAAKTDTSNGAQPTSTDGADPAKSLPIHPKVTPAMGIAGAILLISGAIYAFIGIRSKLLYIFFSAAYLTALAVTVLIVYLMDPPVSNAVQGGFLVAAVLSGMIFGGLALVFSDLTEGLGCLIGGFCLSMWFLTTREGGLIRSATGRAIFIACMSAAGYCLSFSHYTRTYGLMGSISVAGATITILGVDCFTRAGWKEFWLYLWDLSPDSFPLDTNTYPMTRAIKVEVACVALLAFFAIVSQLKLWRIMKQRQEQAAVEMLERERNAQREDEEAGQRIRARFSRERERWEATYGDNRTPRDSAIESFHKGTPKSSLSVQEKETSSSEGVEMIAVPLKHSASIKGQGRHSIRKNAATKPTVTVTVLPEEDESEHSDMERSPALYGNRASIGQSSTSASAANSSRMSSDVTLSGEGSVARRLSAMSLNRSSVSPSPVAVPLPSQVRKEEDGSRGDAYQASVSVAVESHLDSIPNQRLVSKRASGGFLSPRLSMGRAAPDGSEEALMISQDDDDRASSLAATVDDELDKVTLANLSEPQSRRASTFYGQVDFDTGVEATGPDDPRLPTENSQRDHYKSVDEVRKTEADVPPVVVTQDTIEGAGRQTEHESNQSNALISNEPMPESTWARGATFSSPRVPPGAELPDAKDRGESGRILGAETSSSTPPSATPPPPSFSKDVLSDKVSKVALSYRTNEWAKHLELAEQPVVDELADPQSPDVELNSGPMHNGLPVKHETFTVKVPKKKNSNRMSTTVKPQLNSAVGRSSSNLLKHSSKIASVAGAYQSDPVALNRGKRSSSSPLLRTDSVPARGLNTPSPVPSLTLLNQRESLVRNRISSQTLTPLSSSSNLLSELDQEDMTLAQRKQLIQQQQQQQQQKFPPGAQPRRQSSKAIKEKTQDFDSHQPRRSSAAVDPNRRDAMLANWRESMRQDVALAQSTKVEDERSRRAALINERRQKEIEKQEQTMKSQQRESLQGNAMRSGEMLDAHRDAMRRLQAKATRNAA